jgi:hypothetical protein
MAAIVPAYVPTVALDIPRAFAYNPETLKRVCNTPTCPRRYEPVNTMKSGCSACELFYGPNGWKCLDDPCVPYALELPVELPGDELLFILPKGGLVPLDQVPLDVSEARLRGKITWERVDDGLLRRVDPPRTPTA